MTQRHVLYIVLLLAAVAWLNVGCAKRPQVKALDPAPTPPVPCEKRVADVEAELIEVHSLYSDLVKKHTKLQSDYFNLRRLFGNALREQREADTSGK